MSIHNILEEQVLGRVKVIYEQAAENKLPWLTCVCERCQLDTACFVLNRMTPRYLVSSRGVTYSTNKTTTEQKQLAADIDTLVIEGMRRVSSAKRPYHDQVEYTQGVGGPVYNFPTIVGTVFEGSTFEPVKKAEVSLFYQGKLVSTIDKSWQNPYHINQHTQGSYTFWLAPMTAKTVGSNQVFHFELHINAEGYDPIIHSFDIPVVSEETTKNALNASFSLKIQELYLFPKSTVSENESN